MEKADHFFRHGIPSQLNASFYVCVCVFFFRWSIYRQNTYLPWLQRSCKTRFEENRAVYNKLILKVDFFSCDICLLRQRKVHFFSFSFFFLSISNVSIFFFGETLVTWSSHKVHKKANYLGNDNLNKSTLLNQKLNHGVTGREVCLCQPKQGSF